MESRLGKPIAVRVVLIAGVGNIDSGPEGAQENPLDIAWPGHALFREHVNPVHADRQFRQIPVVSSDLFLPGLGPVIALAHDRAVVIR